MPGFEELVKGYVEGQTLQQKKAKEIADRHAEKWEQDFKVQQAQTQAKNAADQLELEKRRVGTEEKQADLRDKEIKRKEKLDEANIKLRELTINHKFLVDTGKLDLNDKKQADKLHEDFFKIAVVDHDYDVAMAMADQHMADLAKSRSQQQPLISALSQMAPQGGQEQQSFIPSKPAGPSGNPIMDALSQRQYHGFNAPSERPDAMSHLGPMYEQKLKEKAAATAEKQQKEKLEKAKTDFQEATNKSAADMKKAELVLKKALGAKKLQDITQSAQKFPLDLESIKAKTEHERADTLRVKSQSDLNRANIERVHLEVQIKKTESKDGLTPAQINGIRNQNRIDVEERSKSAKRMQDTLLKMKAYEAKVVDPNTDAAKKITYQGIINTLSGDLSRQTEEFEHYNERLNTSNQWMQKYHLMQQSTPSGNPAPGTSIAPYGGSTGGPAGAAIIARAAGMGLAPTTSGAPVHHLTRSEVRAGRPKDATVASPKKSKKKKPVIFKATNGAEWREK